MSVDGEVILNSQGPRIQGFKGPRGHKVNVFIVWATFSLRLSFVLGTS